MDPQLADCSVSAMQDTAVELEIARQEVVALRSRVQQLESDTASSSSLELKHLSLRQVSLFLCIPVANQCLHLSVQIGFALLFAHPKQWLLPCQMSCLVCFTFANWIDWVCCLISLASAQPALHVSQSALHVSSQHCMCPTG